MTRITLSALLLAATLAGQSQPKYALVETREFPGNHKDDATIRQSLRCGQGAEIKAG